MGDGWMDVNSLPCSTGHCPLKGPDTALGLRPLALGIRPLDLKLLALGLGPLGLKLLDLGLTPLALGLRPLALGLSFCPLSLDFRPELSAQDFQTQTSPIPRESIGYFL